MSTNHQPTDGEPDRKPDGFDADDRDLFERTADSLAERDAEWAETARRIVEIAAHSSEGSN